jgi:hypothetical protein
MNTFSLQEAEAQFQASSTRRDSWDASELAALESASKARLTGLASDLEQHECELQRRRAAKDTDTVDRKRMHEMQAAVKVRS